MKVAQDQEYVSHGPASDGRASVVRSLRGQAAALCPGCTGCRPALLASLQILLHHGDSRNAGESPCTRIRLSAEELTALWWTSPSCRELCRWCHNRPPPCAHVIMPSPRDWSGDGHIRGNPQGGRRRLAEDAQVMVAIEPLQSGFLIRGVAVVGSRPRRRRRGLLDRVADFHRDGTADDQARPSIRSDSPDSQVLVHPCYGCREAATGCSEGPQGGRP